MQNGQIVRSYEDRGFWAHFFYPVCLVQEFKPCPMRVVEEYLCDCDRFHDLILKERIKWLKAENLAYRCNYTINVPPRDESDEASEPTTYTLILEFKDKATAAAYRSMWE